MALPVGLDVPPRVSAPALSVMPNQPDELPLMLVNVSGNGRGVLASVPAKVSWKPWLLGLPLPPKPVTETQTGGGQQGEGQQK